MYVALFAFFFFALLFSFFCSLWEAVLLSITPSHAKLQSQKSSRIGRYLEDFKENIDRPLTAILTLNTIAHTVGAIGVGASAVEIWEEANPWITRIVVPAVMTIAILVFSEIVPKTIGALYWQRLVTFTVLSLRLLLQVLAPFVWASQYVTRRFKSDTTQPIMTRTDFIAMAEIGAESGVFKNEEKEIIGHVIRSPNIAVREVMTPSTVVEAASENWKISDYYQTVKDLPFSRIPVYGEKEDHITGYVLKSDLLCALIDNGKDQQIATHRREIVAVNERFSITELFDELRKRQEQVAVVLDDFGGMSGIITMEDILESLLGLEIVDETDNTVDMRELAKRHQRSRTESLSVLDEKRDSETENAISTDFETLDEDGSANSQMN